MQKAKIKRWYRSVWQFVAGSRLQQKFALSFVFIAVLPLLILGGITLYLITLSHRYDVANLELQLIDQKKEEIEKFFADTLGVLDLRVGFTQRSEVALADQKFILEGLLFEDNAFEEASFVSLEGKETQKVVRSSGNESELSDLSRHPLISVVKEGKNFVGEVTSTLSGPLMRLAAPVRNRQGDMIQILTAEVNLSQMVRSLGRARLGASGYIFLVDRNGVLITAHEHETVRMPRGADLSSSSRIQRVLQGSILDGLDLQDRYRSVISGVPVAGAGKKIPLLGWGLLAEWPLIDADALLRDVRTQVLRFTLFSILGVVLIASIFSLRLVRPIRDLETSAAKVEEGNFEYQVDIKTNDELEDLGQAFNKMAKGLKRLQELQNEFVFIAAHELRSPVTAVKGYLSLLAEYYKGVLPEQLRPYLEPIRMANDRLIQLVNDLLEIARSEAGRLKIAVSPCDIRESIAAILTEVRPLADQRKIVLTYRELEGLPQIMADPGRVKEVIMNLVSNAIKYNREGGSVEVYHEVAGRRVIIHVEDTGMGISEAEQKRVFEKFFRSESAKVGEIEGTGLGLFITKEIVEKMGGEVWFISEEGKGSRFSVGFLVAS